MKKTVSLLLTLLMVFAFAGCKKAGEATSQGGDAQSSKNDSGRILFGNVDLAEYVELGDYRNITVDTSSDDYAECYDAVVEADVEDYDLYKTKTEGTVAEGDTANIDYLGKKDGVAFEGGTAEGYDLEIGSGTFIDGFEEGLIGVAIGDTVDLNLTFPEGYQSEELAGQDVVFTVTVNYVKSTEALEPEDYYSELGFDSLDAYEADVNERAVQNYLYNVVLNECIVKEYPEEDLEYLTEKATESYELQLSTYYGVSIDEYVSQNSMTREEFDNTLVENEVKPMMDQNMPMYAIVDAENLEITSKDIDEKIAEIVEQQNNESITDEYLSTNYGEYYFEYMIANQKAMECLVKYATVK